MRYWFSCLFVLLLLVPAIVGLPGNASMKHNPISAPGLAAANFKTPEYYRAWKTFLKQRLSDLPQAARAKNWLDYRLFAMSDHGSIHVGRAGWLFSKQDIAAFRKGDCDDAAGAARLHLELNVLARLLKKAGKHFAFVVSPGKATLYPEYLGKVPAAGHCGKSFLDLLLEEQARQSVDGFLQLEGPLKKAKENGTAVYAKTGGVMSQAGARIAARVLLGQLFGGRGPDTTRGRPGGDLAAALLDPQPSGNTMAGVPATSVPATALVYGSREAGVLLPELAPHFERVDVMMGPTLPSLNHGESPGNYEAVIVVLPESKLAAFQIDLNRLCALLGAGGLADHRSSLPLKTLRSRGHLSLELVDQQLAVKSLGADSFFALPALPGSDAATLRLLELVISSARADALTWFIGDAQPFKGEDALRPGTNKIYIPMPQGRTARVRVNPGQYAGLFYLEGVKLLEYEGPAGQSGLDATRTPAGIPLQADGKAAPARPAPVPEDAQSALSQGMEEAASPPAIHLTEFEDGCIFQRRGEVADIVVSGTYEGHPAAVEARVLSYGTDEPVTAWTQIDATPRQGVFMGILPEVPQGGWYRMAVRFRDNIDIAGRGEARWGVGILAACIGQSNMKEWFHSGDSLTAHSLLSVHREGHWRPGALTGNGAIAFGNRLIGRLGVPVG
ncbi:MAG: hypothetical protein P8X55_10580, partial [Desulfosarcinaceae bacterium]